MERRFPGFGDDDDAPPTPEVSAAAEPTTPPPTTPERRLALLIGNSAYRSAPLRNPVRDTRLVGEALRQLGFDVTAIEDATLPDMRRAVAEFVRALGDSDPASVALIYFAGHGVQAGGINYLIPVDADLPDPGTLPARALPLDEVVALLAQRPRHANILVLDACRSASADTSGFSGGLAALDLPPAGMLVAYSTAAGRGAKDGTGQNSPYAEALAQRLPGLLEPGRRAHDVFVDTADAVRAATSGAQNPALFLQGGLPALTLAPQDEERRLSYDPWGPARARRTALRTAAALLALLLAGVALLTWSGTDPERRYAWLQAAGLTQSPAAALSCLTPPPGHYQDAWGMTPDDWCSLLPADIQDKATRSPDFTALHADALASGDAKALFLRAIATFRSDNAMPGDQRAAFTSDLTRAKRAGLPAAGFLLHTSGALPDTGPALTWSAEQGYIPAQVNVLEQAARNGDPAPVIEALMDLRARDASGSAALLLSRLYARDVSDAVEIDMSKSAAFAEEAAHKGNLDAIAALFALQNDGRTDLSMADRSSFLHRYLAAAGPDQTRAMIDELLRSGTQTDAENANFLRGFLQNNFEGDEALAYLDAALRASTCPPDPEALLQQLDTAVSTGTRGARRLRAEVRMGFLPAETCLQQRSFIDAPGAYDDLSSAIQRARDPRAQLLLAQYFLLGVGGPVDLPSAETALQQTLAAAQTSADDAVTAEANALLAALTTRTGLAAAASLADWQIGPDSAPLSIDLLFDPACPACAVPDLIPALDWLVATHVSFGFARLTLRPVTPEGADPVALSALLCTPKPLGADTLHQLYANALDLTALPATCLGSAASDTLARQNTARRTFLPAQGLASDPPGLPVLLVNGTVLPDPTQSRLAAASFAALSPERQSLARFAFHQACTSTDLDDFLSSMTHAVTAKTPSPFCPGPTPP